MTKHFSNVEEYAGGKRISRKPLPKGENNMPVAKTFDEFNKNFTDFLVANKVEFAIYIAEVGVLPKDEKISYAMFSEDREGGDEEDKAAVQITRLATMFYSLCENKKLNVKDQMKRLCIAITMAAIKCGDTSFDED